MLSYRFAIRLGHHVRIATARSKVQIRQRQVIPLSRQRIYTLDRATISRNSCQTILLPRFTQPFLNLIIYE